MKFLTFEQIKAQLRLDDQQAELEKTLLTVYGNSAERVVMQLCRRSIENIVAYFGTADEPVPSELIQAALLLVGQSYQHREPASTQNMSVVPYAFDLLVKPYMRLADDVTQDGDLVLGSQAKILVSLDLPGGFTMKDVNFTVKVCNRSRLCPVSVDVPKSKCIYVCDNSYVVMVDTADLGVGQYTLQVTAYIPDTDYQRVTLLADCDGLLLRTADDRLLCVGRIPGLRKEIINVNPHVNVIL